ncbi:MAG: hypothetical protein CMP53_09255 [Flavobacteriales bacterium]|nr:hypothetical protein [Flavobacteriales bacterium]
MTPIEEAWNKLYKEELDLYDEHEGAHFECTTCEEIFPNCTPLFIPLLLGIECLVCFEKRMEASQ